MRQGNTAKGGQLHPQCYMTDCRGAGVAIILLFIHTLITESSGDVRSEVSCLTVRVSWTQRSLGVDSPHTLIDLFNIQLNEQLWNQTPLHTPSQLLQQPASYCILLEGKHTVHSQKDPLINYIRVIFCTEIKAHIKIKIIKHATSTGVPCKYTWNYLNYMHIFTFIP